MMSFSRLSPSRAAVPPLYGMPIAGIFLSEDEKTFQHDDSLPALPVPPLHQTLSKYLDSGMNEISCSLSVWLFQLIVSEIRK